MFKVYILFVLFFSSFIVMGQEKCVLQISISKALINNQNTMIKVERANHNRVGAIRKEAHQKDDVGVEANIEIHIKVPKKGVYILEAETGVIDQELLKKEDKTGKMTLMATFKLGDQRPTKRIVFDSYRGGSQELGKFEFQDENTVLKIWIPKNLIFYSLCLKPYIAPIAPIEAESYQPTIVPTEGHPRLWMNKESYPIIKSRLNSEEHRQAWETVSKIALKPYTFNVDYNQEIYYNEDLESVIEKKAFYYLMTKDKRIGEEVVKLTVDYLSVLEFGNVSYGDITRELGRAIYTGALVYDWCYDLLDADTKNRLRKELMRLVEDMEIGWPPFYGLESIINGHGNEAQICRDMLSWSLAIYDEDPDPYKYISYTILEQLVPMRKFEYQSPRHNQGIDYGGYRFGWEMHAVWLYYRMLGYSVFDDNIKNMSDYWLYMRTPDGKMLRDGDMFNVKYNAEDDFYWKNPQTMLLCYAFSGNPLIKGEFLKQGSLPNNPVLFLLLNDPNIKPDFNLAQLPLTKDFGPVLGSMVARTGWDENKLSSNVVAEIKGGGYHFGNHQHADAGALQIYHHGNVVADLGLYLSYGSPYDFNFNKRSVSHSMMLIRDPNEPLLFRTKTNDGGARFSQRFPKKVEEVLGDSWFHTGFVRSSAYAPDELKPQFSYFNVDLTAAYTSKVKEYSKSFLFVNTGDENVPAFIILWDDIVSSNKEFEKYWQINTLNRPTYVENDVVLHSSFAGKSGKTYLNMVKPSVEERSLQVLSADSSTYVFGDMYKVKSPWAEAQGSRLLVAPKEDKLENEFVTIFQMVEEDAGKLEEFYEDKGNYGYFVIGDKIIIMAKPRVFLDEEIVIKIPVNRQYDVILAGVEAGFWNVKSNHDILGKNVSVLKGKNVLFFEKVKEDLYLTPNRVYQANESSN